jgi:hypothetical protein
MNVPTREELAWCGGLFEGEGCFYTSTRRGRRVGAAANLTMTDFDTVERFAAIIGAGSMSLKPPAPDRKPALKWELHGFEALQALMAYLWPWLGQRRRAKAIEVLEVANAARVRRRNCPHRGMTRTTSGDCPECKRESARRIRGGERIYTVKPATSG